jgi:hypothetical protein
MSFDESMRSLFGSTPVASRRDWHNVPLQPDDDAPQPRDVFDGVENDGDDFAFDEPPAFAPRGRVPPPFALVATPHDRDKPRYAVKGRLCFGKESSPSGVLAQRVNTALWSPDSAASPMRPGFDGATRRARRTKAQALERHMPGLFAVAGGGATSATGVVGCGIRDAAAQKGDAAQSPGVAAADSCCICLEAIDTRTPLCCPKCCMRAHPSCLAKWFGMSVRRHAKAGLPHSSASCPYCRGALDWDAVALHSRLLARRRKDGLGQKVPLALAIPALSLAGASPKPKARPMATAEQHGLDTAAFANNLQSMY